MAGDKLAVESATETFYKVGDIALLRDDLEFDKKYPMYGTGVVDVYISLMKKGEVVTITDVSMDYRNGNPEGDNSIGVKYYIDDSSDFMYTDSMFVGKLIEISDFNELSQGDLVLMTSDDTTNLNEKYLGQVATFVSNTPMGVLLELPNNERLVLPYIIASLWVEGMFYNPVEFYCSLIGDENEDICDICSVENNKENGESEMTEAVQTQEELVGVKPLKSKSEVFIPEEIGSNGVVSYNIKVDKIVHSNPATILFYRTGAYDSQGNFFVPEDSKQKKVVAKAQYGDVYDAQKGLQICVYKMFNRESAKRLKQLSK